MLWESNLPKPEYSKGVNCSSSLLSLALSLFLIHSSGYTPGGDSYHFSINFLFLLSLRPHFLPALSLPAAFFFFSLFLNHFWGLQGFVCSPYLHKYSTVQILFSPLIILRSLILLPEQFFPCWCSAWSHLSFYFTVISRDLKINDKWNMIF